MSMAKREYMRKAQRRINAWLKRHSSNFNPEQVKSFTDKFMKESEKMYDEISELLNIEESDV